MKSFGGQLCAYCNVNRPQSAFASLSQTRSWGRLWSLWSQLCFGNFASLEGVESWGHCVSFVSSVNWFLAQDSSLEGLPERGRVFCVLLSLTGASANTFFLSFFFGCFFFLFFFCHGFKATLLSWATIWRVLCYGAAMLRVLF